MKLAVIADIHANLPALEVVLEHLDSWRPDAVVQVEIVRLPYDWSRAERD